MRQEIREQPAALERTLRLELAGVRKLRARLEASRPRLVVLAARGTSDNAAQFGRYLIEITTGIPVVLAAPSVATLYHSRLEYADALVVAVSQSGESTDTNVVLEEAKQQGAFTIGVTNEASSSLAGAAHHTILVRAGREKSVAATKTYTSQLMAMYLLAWALGADIAIEDLKRLSEWAEAALKIEDEIGERAIRYRFMDHALVIGRGLNYSNALELGLKMMETCYIVAERFSAADLLHGPIAIVEASFPAFLFAPSGVTWPLMQQTHQRLESLRAETLTITDRSNKEAPTASLRIPASLSGAGARPADLYTPIPYIIPAQLFVASLAEVKGLDPDRPRGLTKVTQTL
jgi:glutamine---fructose-6-phosphate transaminase (isomerizing)